MVRRAGRTERSAMVRKSLLVTPLPCTTWRSSTRQSRLVTLPPRALPPPPSLRRMHSRRSKPSSNARKFCRSALRHTHADTDKMDNRSSYLWRLRETSKGGHASCAAYL